jgi:hypothetical protein
VKLQVTAQPLQVRMLRAQRKMTSPYALAGKRKQVRVAIHASSVLMRHADAVDA